MEFCKQSNFLSIFVRRTFEEIVNKYLFHPENIRFAFSSLFHISAYEGVFVVYLYFLDGAGAAVLPGPGSGNYKEKKFF